MHPVLAVGGLNLVGQNLRVVAFFCQELFELLLGIRAYPACVDERTLAILNGGFHNFQRFLLFFSERVRVANVLRLDDGFIAVRIEDGPLVIRLIRIDGQQVQIRGKNFFRRAAVCP